MKNLEERLQKGIQFGKGADYEAYMNEVEQVISACIDIMEGKPGPKGVDHIEANGGKSGSGKSIMAIRYDGTTKLLVEFGKSTVRVQLGNRNAIVCNEQDAKVLRDFQEALKNNPMTEDAADDDDDVPEFIRQFAEAVEGATGAKVAIGKLDNPMTEDALKQASEGSDFDIDKAVNKAREEAMTLLTMSRLHCPREIAEGIVKSYTDFMKNMN